MFALPIDTDQIVITASRLPEKQADTPASVTVIDRQRIARLGEPLVPALLRLTPSAAVDVSGPAGSETDVRIRGAEANHTLLFVDGIKINDPAAGDAPRFELLNADLASRIEVVRGPESALWGSEAIGGVIAVNGLADAAGYSAAAEGGSFGFRRASTSEAVASSKMSLSGALGWERATGIDSFTGHGDKDGYRNVSGRLRGSWKITPGLQVGAALISLAGRSEFDGFDPVTYEHTETLDSTRNALRAARAWTDVGDSDGPWSGQISASLLRSSNRNYLADEQINRTKGTRRNITVQVEHRFSTGPIANTLIAAAGAERETFQARDTIYGGFSDQDRNREHRSLTFEWRGEAKRLSGDLAIRRDSFNRFKDATAVRASLLARLGGGFALAGSYSEGIAQPTFFDLYGFFPNDFLGNPSLKPESSRGFEASLRYRRGPVTASLTGYRQRLHDEIVDVYDPGTRLFSAANRSETSRRVGVEAEFAWDLSDGLRFSANYAFLRATQPDASAITQVRELRRPKHSGSLALDGQEGRFSYGASLAYVGPHLDQRDTFPFDRVALGSYWLAGARIGFAVRTGVELFARAANALNQHYQDVFGYRTEPRAIYAGLKFSGG